MQQYKQPTANQQMVQPLAPKKKATNRNVTAISSLPKSNHANAGSVEKAPAPGSNVAPDYKPGFGMPTTPVPGNGNVSDTPGYDLPNQPPNLPTPGNPTPPQTGGNVPGQNGGSNGQSPGVGQGLMWQPPQYNPVGGSAARPEYNAPKGNYTPAEYESVTGNAPQFESNTPQTEFNGREYQSNGYTGVQGKSDYKYDPRSESMVQNQITGLLDPESDLMRKAISQAQGYSASRGLQSSSIGSETALSTMIDKALPIAQQDASTNANADQAGWQNSFTAEQNNLGREHDASMFDKQGELNTNLQNDQLGFQNTQNNANREQQTELQQLQYKQSLGMLDAQGEQRMQELNAQLGFQDHMQDKQHGQNVDMLERQEQVQKRRDELMSQLEMGKIDKLYLQDLEKTKLTWEHDDSVFERNLNGQFQLEYRQSSAEAYNRYLEQVANVFGNPNMTPEQQNAGATYLKNMFESQRQQMQIIYGYSSGNSGGGGTGPQTGISNPNNPVFNNPDPNTGPQQPIIPGNPGGNPGGNQYIGGNVGGGAPGGGVRDRQLMR